MGYTKEKNDTMAIPVEPAVLGPVRVTNAVTGAAAKLLIPVPWKDCKFVYAVACPITAVDTVGAMEMKIELNASGGTSLGTITVAAGTAAGAAGVEASLGTASARASLSYDNLLRDYINIEAVGSTTGAGVVDLYLYFENQTTA